MSESLRQSPARLGVLPAVATLLLVFSENISHGAETVLFSGGTQPLVTIEREVEIPSAIPKPFLSFRFGFSTEEIFEPGELIDSFSVLLRNPSSGEAGFLLTADASGIVWTPTMEGGFQLDPGALVRQPIPFADVEPRLGNQLAYEVSFTLPEAFAGERVNVVFDLFDNQNTARSLGYFSHLTVVPEPSTWLMGALGAALVFFFTRNSKKS